MQRPAVGIVPCVSTQPHLPSLPVVPSAKLHSLLQRKAINFCQGVRKKDQRLGLVEVGEEGGGRGGGGAFLAGEQQVSAQVHPPLS